MRKKNIIYTTVVALGFLQSFLQNSVFGITFVYEQKAFNIFK